MSLESLLSSFAAEHQSKDHATENAKTTKRDQSTSECFTKCAPMIVCGGSLTGLACAYSLSAAGHHVHVIERESGLNTGTGPVKSPPNLTRILYQWGLEDEIKRWGIRCPRLTFRSGATGDYIGAMVFHDEIVQELQAEMVFLSHSDLHSMLYNLAIRAGAQVQFGTEVVNIDTKESSITVIDSNQSANKNPSSTSRKRKLTADVIVGADGVDSLARRVLLGLEDGDEERMKAGPYAGHCFTVPASKLEKDPELRELLNDSGWNLWMKDGCFITHPVHAREELAISFMLQPSLMKSSSQAKPGWQNYVPVTDFDFGKFDKRIQRLVSIAPGGKVIKTKHTILDPLEDWFNDEGNLVLMGDALHVLNPGCLHGVALGIEDAAVFGALFSYISRKDQILPLLSAFQELRADRCQSIFQSEITKVNFVCLPDGPEQISRDEALRTAGNISFEEWEEAKDEYFEQSWGLEFEGPFNYDAYEAAEEWWVEWGVLTERSEASHHITDGYQTNQLEIMASRLMV